MKFQVIVTNPEEPTQKAATGAGISANITANVGTHFPDGGPIATAVGTAATTLTTANNNYETSDSPANESARDLAVIAMDLQINNAILYVQGKVNSILTLETAISIAVAAGMQIKSQGSKSPVPETVTTADAVFTNEPGTIMITLKKAPKYTKWLEVWVTTTPEVESSWKLTETFSGRRCMVDSLTTGTKYYFRLKACNSSGKSTPSNPFDQQAA